MAGGARGAGLGVDARLGGSVVSATILTGDCRDVLATLPEASFDSCVTDPPYHLTSIVRRFSSDTAAPAKSNGATGVYARASSGFMGQKWDGGDLAFQPALWAAVYRVLKPGAHLLAFSGTRTQHRMVCAIEDAGFEIRDQIGWAYGSGFPKSHNLDGEWQGWGTALKPAWEPICVARKPLVGTVAANVLQHGTGALNIDGCRVGTSKEVPASVSRKAPANCYGRFAEYGETRGVGGHDPNLGRWPANLVHDGSDEVLAGFPETASGVQRKPKSTGGVWSGVSNAPCGPQYGDEGSASRFFYCAKASRAERGEGNDHPTVKPVALMRWLVRLVTPPGGSVLDPFGGSGSTGVAVAFENFNATLIEMDPRFAEIARRRIVNEAGLFGLAAE
jgi:site-specific DNA-methyltransferase (adenine-specific)